MAALTRPLIQKLNVGELSPRLRGFVGFEKYASGCRALENMLPLTQGPVTRTPGTRFVAEVKDSTKRTALLAFEFNEEQAYAIEVGDLYHRFCKDKGQILSGGSPYEISSVYAWADLFEANGRLRLRKTQSADVMYQVHADYPPYKLTRTGHTNWTQSKIAFVDGPYLDENIETTTLTPSAASGAILVTASAVTGINKGAGFKTEDIGRMIRIGYRVTPWAASTAYVVGNVVLGQTTSRVYQCIVAGTTASAGGPTGTGDAIADGTVTWKYIGEGGIFWGYGTITGWNSTTQVGVALATDLLGTTATAIWQLGRWADHLGWPVAAGFHAGRLYYGGSATYPQTLNGSKIAEFDTYKPGILDDDAISVTMDSNKVNAIRWFASQRDLLIGTSGGEAKMSQAISTQALGPVNVDIKFQTKHGSEAMEPVEGANAVLFVQNLGRALREMAFTIEADGYRAPDMTELAEHLAAEQFIALAYAPVPHSIVWVLRADGLLCSMTYNRDAGVIAWARHPLTGTDTVEAICTIPGTDTAGEATGFSQLWMICKRTIGGATKRFIEVMEDPFTDAQNAADAWFLDCAVQYSGTPADTIGGATHLAGETVGVWADGGEHPDVVVSAAGEVTLNAAYGKVLIGKKRTWKVIPMPPEIPSEGQPSSGAKKQLIGARVLFDRTLGANFGPEGEEAAVDFRDATMEIGDPPDLFSLWKDLEFFGDSTRSGEFSLTGDNGGPVTICAIAPLYLVNHG